MKIFGLILDLIDGKCRMTDSVICKVYNGVITMEDGSMEEAKKDKVKRVLEIYTKLLNGHMINISEEAVDYGVNERSIQRDFHDIMSYGWC